MTSIRIKVKQLLEKGFFHILFGNTAVKIIAFISSIVIVRLVDKEAYAHLAYADNLYNYILSLAGLGATAAVLKCCASAESPEKDKAYFWFGTKFSSVAILILSTFIVIYSMFAEITFPEARTLIYILVLYPFINNVLALLLNYNRAHGYNQRYANAALIQTFVVFVCSVIFTLVFGVVGVPIARYVATVVALLILVKTVKERQVGINNEKLTTVEKREFFVMSFSLLISNFFSLVMPINEMTVINEWFQSEFVTANYKVAIMIPGQLIFITQSIVVYYFTIVAKTKDGKEIWNLSKKVFCLNAGVVGAVTLVGAVLTPFIIRFVYGEQYADAINLSTMFWIVNAMNAIVRYIPMNFLPAIGVVKFNAVMAIVSSVVHLGLTILFISVLGIWGTGISTGIIYLVTGLLYWGYYKKKCAVLVPVREER